MGNSRILTSETDCKFRPPLVSVLESFQSAQLPVDGGLKAGLLPMGDGIFSRYACKTCQSCIPARVDVRRFEQNRSQTRNLAGNSDLSLRYITEETLREDDIYAHAALYYAHLVGRRFHNDEIVADEALNALVSHDAYENAVAYTEMLAREFSSADAGKRLMEVYLPDGELVGGMLMTLTASAAYLDSHHYHPEHSQRGLGTFLILKSIEFAMDQGVGHVYLGPWTNEDISSVHYKSNFNGPRDAFEILTNGGWQSLNNVPQEQRVRPDDLQGRIVHKLTRSPS